MHDNGGPGIDLVDGGNAGLLAPSILSVDLVVGVASGIACPGCLVEIFSDAGDEGSIFEARGTADGSGFWNIDKGAAFAGPGLSATATDAGGNTSEFGFVATVIRVLIPWLSRGGEL